jgi:hypothetical protein
MHGESRKSKNAEIRLKGSATNWHYGSYQAAFSADAAMKGSALFDSWAISPTGIGEMTLAIPAAIF